MSHNLRPTNKGIPIPIRIPIASQKASPQLELRLSRWASRLPVKVQQTAPASRQKKKKAKTQLTIIAACMCASGKRRAAAHGSGQDSDSVSTADLQQELH